MTQIFFLSLYKKKKKLVFVYYIIHNNYFVEKIKKDTATPIAMPLFLSRFFIISFIFQKTEVKFEKLLQSGLTQTQLIPSGFLSHTDTIANGCFRMRDNSPLRLSASIFL